MSCPQTEIKVSLDSLYFSVDGTGQFFGLELNTENFVTTFSFEEE